MPTYRPDGLKQINPTDPNGRYSCGAYSTAVLVDYATIGGVKVSGKYVRSLTDEAVPDPASPGLSIPQLVAAAKKLNVELTDRSGLPWSSLVDAVRGGRGVLINVLYEALPIDYRAQLAPAVGGHAMAITQLDPEGNRGLVYDPLRGKPLWIPLAALSVGAVSWAKKLGSGGVIYATTRVVPKVAV